MPAHKNQHFVPRCALKPFTFNGKGKGINVFNISSKRAIQNAPVKGQCARDYLYAKEDLTIEKGLITLEGHYARIVVILSAGGVLGHEDIDLLKTLMLIQMRRTELAVERIRGFTKGMGDTAYARAPHQQPIDTRTDRGLMHLLILLQATIPP